MQSPSHPAKAARIRSRAWEKRPVMAIAAETPMTVAMNRKQAFSNAGPRVGAARIATVMAAVEGASSCSQKLTAKATTIAIQIRIPNAQELIGAPAKLNGRTVSVAVVI